jgi:GT2 family glycosyltransferase
MAVAIINWNTRDMLRRCLHSVLAEAPVEVVVVDNGSSDGSADMVAQEFPTVTLKVLAANPGYGAGCNAGVRACTAEYVLVLNSDTLVRPGALAALTGVLDRQERAAIVGPRIVNPDGSLQPSCYPFPGPAARLFRREPFATVAAWVPWLRERYVGRWRYDRLRRVPWVLGAAFGIRRTSFEEVGGFDETFVMYYEEVDLCFRLRAHHWETLFAPVTDVTHIGGASTSQRRGEMLARYELSLIAFHRRHDRGMALALGVGVVRLHAAVRFLGDAIRYRLTSGREQRERLAEDLAVWRDIMFRSSHTM